MNKKLSVSLLTLVMIASAGVAMPAFANNGVGVSASAEVRINNKDEKDKKKEMRNDWKDQEDAMRKKMDDKRDDMKKQSRGWFNFFRGKSIDVRNDIKAGWRNLIEARWRFVGNGFENVMARLESRIDKVEKEGKNVTTAKKHLADARISFNKARDKAAELAEDSKEDDLTVEEKMKARTEIESHLKEAKASLKLSVQALVDAK